MTSPGAVLVVDDDSTIRTVVAAALRRDGHRVTTAASLAELRREMRLAVPDVLVTDVVLPDGNGLDFVAALMGEQPDLPVIVFSASPPPSAPPKSALSIISPSPSISTCSATRSAARSPRAAAAPPTCPISRRAAPR